MTDASNAATRSFSEAAVTSFLVHHDIDLVVVLHPQRIGRLVRLHPPAVKHKHHRLLVQPCAVSPRRKNSLERHRGLDPELHFGCVLGLDLRGVRGVLGESVEGWWVACVCSDVTAGGCMCGAGLGVKSTMKGCREDYRDKLREEVARARWLSRFN